MLVGTLFFPRQWFQWRRTLEERRHAEGTVQVKDVNSGAGSSSITQLNNINGKLYFRANDGSGVKSWVSDGTTAGTISLVPGTPIGSFGEFFGRAVFAETNGNVWTTDGTVGGTQLLTASSAAFSESSVFVTIGDSLFTNVGNDQVGFELFKFNAS